MSRIWTGEEDEATYAERRREMVDDVLAMAQEVSPAAGGAPAMSPRVLEALGRVLRHRFVPPEERRYAYQNRPLSIGYGQTISQPYIVALMTDLLALKPGDKVLEIGTGCGYQAAVLAELGAEVFSVEIVGPLAERAGETLRAEGYGNVHVKADDGNVGWPEHAPYDGVIVTAAASHVPQPLVDQLKPGGRMAIPLGEAFDVQELLLIQKSADGQTHSRNVLPVRFVPLVGGQ